MKSFKSHFVEQQELQEKLLLINNGARYGQIVILAGGAGSGKGFAAANFINSQDYKVRDVDEWKLAFIKIDKLKKKYPEIRGLDLKNPEDVFKLHQFVDSKGIKDKTLDVMLGAITSKERLPNLMFDVTLKNLKAIDEALPKLYDSGYNPNNVHLVWVLTDYKIAIKQNASRERVVPDDIMFETHSGAAATMWDIVDKNKIPVGMNGGIHVILNNQKNTIFFKTDDGQDYRSAGDNPSANIRGTQARGRAGLDAPFRGGKSKGKIFGTIKDFKYLTLKKPGKPVNKMIAIKTQLWGWISANIPIDTLMSRDFDK
jgi:dephospho-CoA kinase